MKTRPDALVESALPRDSSAIERQQARAGTDDAESRASLDVAITRHRWAFAVLDAAAATRRAPTSE